MSILDDVENELVEHLQAQADAVSERQIPAKPAIGLTPAFGSGGSGAMWPVQRTVIEVYSDPFTDSLRAMFPDGTSVPIPRDALRASRHRDLERKMQQFVELQKLFENGHISLQQLKEAVSRG